MRPVGKVRSVVVIILLSIVTLGIHFLAWQYMTFREMKDSRVPASGEVLASSSRSSSDSSTGSSSRQKGKLYTSEGQEPPMCRDSPLQTG